MFASQNRWNELALLSVHFGTLGRYEDPLLWMKFGSFVVSVMSPSKKGCFRHDMVQELTRVGTGRDVYNAKRR